MVSFVYHHAFTKGSSNCLAIEQAFDNHKRSLSYSRSNGTVSSETLFRN